MPRVHAAAQGLISLTKSEPVARKIFVSMHVPADVPELHPARSPPGRNGERDRGLGDAEDYVNLSGDLREGGWG